MKFLKKQWQWIKNTIVGKIIGDIIKGFEHDSPLLYGASIAFYMIFSMPALLIFTVVIAGTFLGEQAAQGQLFYYIEEFVGSDTAEQIQNIIKNAAIDEAGYIAKVVGIATLTFSATTVFVNIQIALNAIWGVRAKPQKGWLKLIMDRLFSFLIVIVLGVLLLTTTLIEALLGNFRDLLVRIFSDYIVYLIEVVSSITNIAIVTLVFALVFKLLPDAKVRWKDVWVGSIVTTILFLIGKGLIGVYLSQSNLSSTYGAAGSLVILLLWVYYSAVIFLVGAEFTKAYSLRVGKEIIPKKNAVRVIRKEIEREVKEVNK
ncbi:YihY/virulence factor BrkB family protein [Catalinimonas niigatensis]|uniref:YihY/virulence factor BrkB family protein n=1 Tax=Catalinimonas niigatensis TaxID=1397264 RepID=UPI002665D033|nr:YihY/virulence factor BrkB family protein [Catalinimonas niigatensis]WPP49378.1 YihY/virulence factor BrkB family protein [Catalinimonas niigatensis]